VTAVEPSATGSIGADDVRVLATSREPLRIAGEARYRLGPLTLPDQATRENPADQAREESEAVTLFADRARRAEAGFTLDQQTRKTVAELVARLDGMPLAIELAAARVDALGVTQLLDRIDDRFALLVDGDRRPNNASGRWPPRCSGATSCWTKPTRRRSARSRCFPARSPWTGPRRWPGPAPGRLCRG
jgi:hypothetical protein